MATMYGTACHAGKGNRAWTARERTGGGGVTERMPALVQSVFSSLVAGLGGTQGQIPSVSLPDALEIRLPRSDGPRDVDLELPLQISEGPRDEDLELPWRKNGEAPRELVLRQQAPRDTDLETAQRPRRSMPKSTSCTSACTCSFASKDWITGSFDGAARSGVWWLCFGDALEVLPASPRSLRFRSISTSRALFAMKNSVARGARLAF